MIFEGKKTKTKKVFKQEQCAVFFTQVLARTQKQFKK